MDGEARRDAWSVVPFVGQSGLDRWRDAWRELLVAAPTAGPFLTPEWVCPWLSVFGKPPRGLVVLEGDAPRGVALLVKERLVALPGAPTVLRPPGLGVSDYLDLLLVPGESAIRAVGLLLDWLTRATDWDLLDLPNVPAESPSADLLRAAARGRGLPTVQLPGYTRPYLELRGDWPSYLASRPGKLRYNLRSRQRKLAALGDLQLRSYTAPAEVAARLQEAMTIHARRWAGQYTSTTFSASASAREFYRQAIPALAERGWLELHTLELDGRMLAFALCFIVDQRLSYYLPAFEPAYARYGPSALVLAHLIEAAYDRCLRELDFMLGDEPYKGQWATSARQTTRLIVAAPGARARVALAAFQTYLTIRERARHSARLQRLRRYGLGALRRTPTTAD